MDRTESYLASDGKKYSIHFEDRRYIVMYVGEIFTVGQQPESAVEWEDDAARAFAVADIEARIRAERPSS